MVATICYQMYLQDTSIILEQRTAQTCLNFEQHSIFHASMPLAYVCTRLLLLGYLLTYLAYLLTYLLTYLRSTARDKERHKHV